MHETAAAAIVGTLVFLSSAIRRTLSTLTHEKPRILLHLGQSSPAAVATLLYLEALSLDIVVTADKPSSLHSMKSTVAAKGRIYTSKPCDVWSFYVRSWAEKGVDIIFSFSPDSDVTRETMQLLCTGGTFVQIEGDLPSRLRRGCNYTSVTYRDILEGEAPIQSALANIEPSIRTLLSPEVITIPLSKLSNVREQCHTTATANSPTVLVNMGIAEPHLPILRAGMHRGTHAFDPRSSYIVIGGVGGLGANIARCLVENGARHVILTSRSGESVRRSWKSSIRT